MPNKELINVKMTKEMVNNTLAFLNRTDLKGVEAPALIEIVTALSIAKIDVLKGGENIADKQE